MKGEMLMKKAITNSFAFLKMHSATVLTCIGAAGVICTAVATTKATIKAMEIINEAECEKKEELTKTEIVKLTVPTYIPAALIGGATIACIFGANVLNKKQQAMLTSAYVFMSESYKEYRNKVAELYGPDANTNIVGSIFKDKFEKDPIDVDENKMLFYDEYSGQYFESTMEDVMAAEYHFNRNFVLRDYAYLNEFYDFLRIDHTDDGDIVGWSSWVGEACYGYRWIDFHHEKITLDDGLECYIIHMPFEPTIDFMEDV